MLKLKVLCVIFTKSLLFTRPVNWTVIDRGTCTSILGKPCCDQLKSIILINLWAYYCHLNKGSNSKKIVLLKHVRNYICLFSTDMQLIEDAVPKKNKKSQNVRLFYFQLLFRYLAVLFSTCNHNVSKDHWHGTFQKVILPRMVVHRVLYESILMESWLDVKVWQEKVYK